MPFKKDFDILQFTHLLLIIYIFIIMMWSLNACVDFSVCSGFFPQSKGILIRSSDVSKFWVPVVHVLC